jgi:hypothetical protein
MDYLILCDDEVIGASNLEARDPSMGFLQGVFVPTDGYERVRPIFRLYTEAGTSMADMDQEKYNQFREAVSKLQLSLATPDGVRLPVDAVHIFDADIELNEYEVTVRARDADAYDLICEAPTCRPPTDTGRP